MKINANTDADLRMRVTVYLNGKKEPDACEVFVPGDNLEGEGYVIRGVRKEGQLLPTVHAPDPLPPNQLDWDGVVCEKVFGHIKVEIAG